MDEKKKQPQSGGAGADAVAEVKARKTAKANATAPKGTTQSGKGAEAKGEKAKAAAGKAPAAASKTPPKGDAVAQAKSRKVAAKGEGPKAEPAASKAAKDDTADFAAVLETKKGRKTAPDSAPKEDSADFAAVVNAKKTRAKAAPKAETAASANAEQSAAKTADTPIATAETPTPKAKAEKTAKSETALGRVGKLCLFMLGIFVLAFGVLPYYHMPMSLPVQIGFFVMVIGVLCALLLGLVGHVYRLIYPVPQKPGQPVYIRLTLVLLCLLGAYLALTYGVMALTHLPLASAVVQRIVNWVSWGLTAVCAPLVMTLLFAALIDESQGRKGYFAAVGLLFRKAYFVLLLIGGLFVGAGWLRDVYLAPGLVRQGVTIAFSVLLWTLATLWLCRCARKAIAAREAL